ncbi:hypothetical protein HOA91_04530 [Candidatus Woesearchaeota archaeon]|jgi:hypothetical protein|nr:hypothetical protein [Candidatus Woesearchaeota archaeon]
MKRNVLFGLLVVFLMIGSAIVIAEETVAEDSCTGFWGKFYCVLFGDPDLKDQAIAGQGMRGLPAEPREAAREEAAAAAAREEAAAEAAETAREEAAREEAAETAREEAAREEAAAEAAETAREAAAAVGAADAEPEPRAEPVPRAEAESDAAPRPEPRAEAEPVTGQGAEESVEKITCTDLDGGYTGDSLIKQTTVRTSDGNKETDTCGSPVRIKEYYCFERNGDFSIKSTLVVCPSGTCEDGACIEEEEEEPEVEAEPVAEPVEPKVVTLEDQAEEENEMLPATRDEESVREVREEVECIDYDNGRDIFEASYVSGDSGAMVGEFNDFCSNSDVGADTVTSGNYVHEYYCVNGLVVGKTLKCEFGCKDGACLKTAQQRSVVDEVEVVEEEVVEEETTEDAAECRDVISKGEEFTLGGDLFQYASADELTDSNPKVKIRSLTTGEVLEYSLSVENGKAKFTVKWKGSTYVFRSISDYNKDDFDIFFECSITEVGEEEIWAREVIPEDVVGGETRCADGLDDDGDGYFDCFDADCSGVDVCKLKEGGKVCCLYHDLKFGAYTNNFDSSTDCLYPDYFDFGVNGAGRYPVISGSVCIKGIYKFGYVPKIVEDTKSICSDDDGNDYYNKGHVSGLNSVTGKFMNFVDFCAEGDALGMGYVKNGPYVKERLCNENDIVTTEAYLCPNGCFDGRCLEESEEVEVTEEEVEEEVEEENILEEVFEIDVTEEEAEPYALGCSGCESDGKCLPFGTRKVVKGTDSFCDLEERWAAQSSLDASCQNDYECLTNECSNGVCSDLAKELEETQNLLQEVLDYVKQFFGVEEETFIIEENFGIIEYVETEFDEKSNVPFNILNNHGEAYGGYYTKGVLAIVQDHDKDVNEKIFIEELLDQASGMKVIDATEFDQHIYCGADPEEENIFFCAWLSEDKVVVVLVENFGAVKDLEDMEESFMENFLPAYLAKYPSSVTLDIEDYAEAFEDENAEVEAEGEIDLANYPEYFVTNGKFNGFFVVGENAPAVDNLAMTDIAASMKLNGKSVEIVDAVMLDVEIDEVTAQNLVIVGKACHLDDNTGDMIIHNKLTNQLLGYPEDCTVGLDEHQSIVELVEHTNGNIAMLVYGQNPSDTRLAAKVIANNPEVLTGKKMLIEGTMWGDVEITTEFDGVEVEADEWGISLVFQDDVYQGTIKLQGNSYPFSFDPESNELTFIYWGDDVTHVLVMTLEEEDLYSGTFKTGGMSYPVIVELGNSPKMTLVDWPKTVGEVELAECVDTDAKVYNPDDPDNNFIKGTTTGIWPIIYKNGENYPAFDQYVSDSSEDWCLGSDKSQAGKLIENYCAGDGYATYIVTDCQDGSYCTKGACVTCSGESCPACYDSDDSVDEFVSGTVTGPNEGQIFVTRSDYCINLGGTEFANGEVFVGPSSVVEFSCTGDAMASIQINCEFGCNSGKCIDVEEAQQWLASQEE